MTLGQTTSETWLIQISSEPVDLYDLETVTPPVRIVVAAGSRGQAFGTFRQPATVSRGDLTWAVFF